MEYALVNNDRVKPRPKTEGICPLCEAPMISKCGSRKIWHWAHKSQKHCDIWWENETEWHRDWKEKFPENCREIVHFDNNGEKHIADVKTKTGLILEFQNSPISSDELSSREAFYQNMIWVINGLNFIKNFHILSPLPDPKSNFAQDLVFWPVEYRYARRSCNNKDFFGIEDFFGMFWRKSENPSHIAGETNLVYLHSLQKIKDEIMENYKGHHHYDWVKPRAAWFESKCLVFIDFGEDVLWKLEEHNNRLRCTRKIPKKEFINDVSC